MTIRSPKHNILPDILKGTLLLLMIFTTSKNFAQNNRRTRTNIGLIYPLSSDGFHASGDTNVVPLNVIAGLSAAEQGLTIAGIMNIPRQDAGGFQLAGFSNHIDRNANGLMVAYFMNTYASGSGTSIASFSNNTGAQIAGFLDKGANTSEVQIAGFINIAGNLKGNQVAGFINTAKKSNGAQVSFINVADSAGKQIGIINEARNDEKSLGLSIDETQTTMLSFRSGGQVFYGIIGVGYNFNNKNQKYAYQAGLGARLVNSGMFRLKTELVCSGLESFKGSMYYKSSSYLMPALKFNKSLELFAGPSFNFVETDNEEGKNLIKHYVSGWSSNNGPDFHGYYFGYTAGIQVRL